jgi:hypothetical protein
MVCRVSSTLLILTPRGHLPVSYASQPRLFPINLVTMTLL